MAGTRRLEAKVAVVTGAASGIGQVIALRFAAEGAAVGILDVDGDGGRRTLKSIQAHAGSAKLVEVDVSDPARTRCAVDMVATEYGGLDILVNNAAIEFEATLEETSEADWERVMASNLRGVFLCSRSAIPHMKVRAGGAIVNIASGNGLLGVPKHAAYSAAKGGVISLTRQLAIDYGPVGIRVSCICPGTTDTPMVRRTAAKRADQNFEDHIRTVPLRRIGSPEDIAAAALFLASDEASWITGAVLPVDGGWSCGRYS